MARGELVWLDGKMLPLESAKISLFTHALHYGTGAFEGIRAYRQKNGNGAVFRLQEHLKRFLESCKILDFKIPYSVDDLAQATLETCKANHFQECYIRPIVFIGDGPLGVNPGASPPLHVAILNWEWGKYLGDKESQWGVKLKISSFIRPHVNSLMTKGKITGQYISSVLAKREAISLGFDEALFLDAEGYLTEGTGENLFMVKDGVIKTTPLNSILNGITRSTVMEYFAHKKNPVVETRFSRDELWCADEVFLTGTAAEITAVREIDSRTIGDGTQGPVSLQLQKDYQALVRGELTPEYAHHWLTEIK